MMWTATRNLAALSVLTAMIAGCESKAGQGAIIGGLAGGALGGVIGHQSDETAAGAAIGAGVGAIGGGLVGHAMDENERKERERDYYRDQYNRDYNRGQYESRDTYGYEPRTSNPVLMRDVIEWSNSGVREEVIIDRIQRSGQVFRLTAADESDLRDAGVSSKVIRTMKDTARR